LPDPSLEQIRRGGQPTDLVGEHFHQFGLRIWSAVGEDVFEVLPDAFVGIQFGSVCGQRDQMKPAGASQERLNRVAAVDGPVVQEDEDVPADVAEEIAQEDDHGLTLDVVVVEVAVQDTMEPPGAHGDAGDGGDPIMTLAMPNDGRLADGTPGLANRGNQEEAGFVDKDEVGCQPRGVSLLPARRPASTRRWPPRRARWRGVPASGGSSRVDAGVSQRDCDDRSRRNAVRSPRRSVAWSTTPSGSRVPARLASGAGPSGLAAWPSAARDAPESASLSARPSHRLATRFAIGARCSHDTRAGDRSHEGTAPGAARQSRHAAAAPGRAESRMVSEHTLLENGSRLLHSLCVSQ